MNFRRLVTLFAIPLVLGLAGCAATVTRDSASAAPASPASATARKVVMEVTGSEQIAQGADWEAFKEEWQTSMTAATSARQASFVMGAPDPASPEPLVFVKLKVNDYRYVSQAKRYGLGIITGNAFMDVDAQFVEYPGGRVLGTRKFQTSSSAWQGIFSAMTPKQVEAVSQQIVGEALGR